MLFHSSVPKVFNKLNLDIYTIANQQRKEAISKAIDLYNSDALSHLEDRLNELYSEPEKMTKVTLNFLRKIVRLQAQTFREPPSRHLQGSDADQALYAKICEDCSLDIVLKETSRMLKLLKSILLKVVWDENKIRIDIICGNQIEHIETKNTPYDLKSVLLVDYGSTNRIEDIEFIFWDIDVYKRTNYIGDTILEQPNVYGALPFIPLFDSYNSSNSFFLPLDDSLISLQEAVNIRIVDLNFLLAFTSYGVGWLRGTTGGGSLKIDPGSLIELPENGAIGFESQRAEIDQVVAAIDKIVKWACVSSGLSAASMSTEVQTQSGISKLRDSIELSEMRQDDISLWRGYEKQLFNLIRIVHNVHSHQKLSESTTLQIDFSDPTKQSLTAKEQAQADDLKIAQGVLSPVDVLLRDNPDFQNDREKGIAHLLQLRDEIRLLTE